MGNRSSANTKPASKAPSVKEVKRTPAKKPPTPVARTTSKATPEKDRTQRRSDGTQPRSSERVKKKEDVENRTAKEVDKKRESQKKKKKSVGKYVDGTFVSAGSAEGAKKKTSRTHTKTSSDGRTDNKKKEPVKGGSERSKRKHAKKPEETVERSTEQTADEKTQDSSARRRRRKAKVETNRSTEDMKTEKTEQTEKTEKTKDEKVPTMEDDNTLVSDAPKRKKYSEDKEENVKAFLKLTIGKGVNGLKEEFLELRKEIVGVKKDEVVEIYSEFCLPVNAPKNRYKDVPCLNESKVVLKDREQSYIHANYCTTPKGEKRFICTQGPNPATYNDFWSMVCQDEVEFIVMLCNFIEMSKPKCDKYFPLEEGEILSTEDFSIQCMAVHGNKWPETVTIRKLIVTKREGEKEKEHTVHHLHWETWPDRGVPPIDQSIFKLLAKVKKSTKPIVVHCSAGIGRTGTTVMIQIALEMLGGGQSLSGGLAPILKRLRKQRAMSVQNEIQYIFIHRVLLDYFKDALDEDEATQFCAEYDKLTK